MKNRLIWADALKGLLIILVVLGHAIQYVPGGGVDNGNHLFAYIYSFHMPAFFAVSGWFAGEASKEKIVRRIHQLLIPYVLWALLFFLWHDNLTVNTLWLMVKKPDSSYWFLWVLFWIYVIFSFTQIVASRFRWNEMRTLAAVCVVLVAIMAVGNIRVMGMQFISYYFVFYFMGYCFRHLELKPLHGKKTLLAFTVVWAFLGWYWQMSHVPSIMKWVTFLPSSLVIQGYRFVTAFLALSVILSVVPKYLDKDTWVTRLLVRLGYISLGIYTFHLLITNSVISFIRQFIPNINNNLLIFVSFVLLTVVSFICVSLISKNKVLSKYLLGKLYIKN